MIPSTISQAIQAAFLPFVPPVYPVYDVDELLTRIKEERALSDFLHASANNRQMTAEQLRALSISCHSTVYEITTGHGTDEHIGRLALTSNMALILAERGLGEDHIGDIIDAQRACISMWTRFSDCGKVGFSGPELVAINRMVEIHDAQIGLGVTNREMHGAAVELHRRLASGQILAAVGFKDEEDGAA